MKLSIIIPCFNEINTIKIILEKIYNNKTYEKEIILVDDNSTDGTKQVIEKIDKSKIDKLIFNEKNYGKGYCVRKGIECSTGDIIIIHFGHPREFCR